VTPGEGRKNGADERAPVAHRLNVDHNLAVSFEHVNRVLHLRDPHRLPVWASRSRDDDVIALNPQNSVRATSQSLDPLPDDRGEIRARFH
jgi:hypothetical protein